MIRVNLELFKFFNKISSYFYRKHVTGLRRVQGRWTLLYSQDGFSRKYCWRTGAFCRNYKICWI